MRKYILLFGLILLIASLLFSYKSITRFIHHLDVELIYVSSILSDNMQANVYYKKKSSNPMRYKTFIQNVQNGKKDSFTMVTFAEKNILNFSFFSYDGSKVKYSQNITYLGETNSALYICTGISQKQSNGHTVYSLTGCDDLDQEELDVFWEP